MTSNEHSSLKSESKRQFGLLQVAGVQNLAEVRRTGRGGGAAGQVGRAEQIEGLALGLDAVAVAHDRWAARPRYRSC